MKNKDVNIRIDYKTYRKLKIKAAKTGLTLKKIVELLTVNA